MKLSQILKYRLFSGRYLIQMSPVRTGSTLLYNILRECFPGKQVEKHHNYSRHFAGIPLVGSVRDPFDALVSIARVNQIDIDEASVVRLCQIFRSHGADDIVRIKDLANVLIVKYDTLLGDPGSVFDQLEAAFQVRIPSEKRTSILQQYGLRAAAAISGAQGEFGRWDPATKIHGNHVSDHASEFGYGRASFDARQTETIQRHLAEYMQAFGYDRD